MADEFEDETDEMPSVHTNRWTEPSTILAAIGTLVLVAGIVWSAAQIAASTVNLKASVDELKASVNSQFSEVKSQIATIPTQEARITAVEKQDTLQNEVNARQDGRLIMLENSDAAFRATMDGMRRELTTIEDAVNGRLPGGQAGRR